MAIPPFSPLRVFKYCSLCGSNNLQVNNEKSLKCSHCGSNYYINMNAATAALIKNNKGEFLFTVRKNNPSKGMLDLPGGFVDLGETAEEAICREIKEELNLEANNISFFGTFPNSYLFAGIEYATLDIVFLVQIDSFQNMQAADDVESYVFKNINEINLDEIAFDSVKKVIRKLIG